MPKDVTLGEVLRSQGVSRRGFLKYCATLTSLMALPPAMMPTVARALESVRRPSVIWLSFQECTGCTESLTRSHTPSVEELIFNHISLDYHHTLQAASGHAAEEARAEAMKENDGKYLVVVDGSVPMANPGYSTIAGISNKQILDETVKGAFAVIAVGSCAAFGGLPRANPNPTGAVAIKTLVPDKPVINVPGCPPIPVVITGVIAHYLTFGSVPELDHLGRPVAFYGESIHDHCYRRPFYDHGDFASSFDDEGARKGWCLYKLGCKGPTTRNSCATIKWNAGTSFPIQAGHPCLGCSEPDFWDGGGFYKTAASPIGDMDQIAGGALAVGAGLGVVGAFLNARKKANAMATREKFTLEDLENK